MAPAEATSSPNRARSRPRSDTARYPALPSPHVGTKRRTTELEWAAAPLTTHVVRPLSLGRWRWSLLPPGLRGPSRASGGCEHADQPAGDGGKDRGERVRHRDPVVDERRPGDPTDDEVEAKGRHDGDIEPIGKAARAPLELHLHHLCRFPALLSSYCAPSVELMVIRELRRQRPLLAPRARSGAAATCEDGNGAGRGSSWSSMVIRSGPFRTALDGTLVARPSRTTPHTRFVIPPRRQEPDGRGMSRPVDWRATMRRQDR
jgi:hypothetical protein